jgi:hypothetical protein
VIDSNQDFGGAEDPESEPDMVLRESDDAPNEHAVGTL